MCCFLSSLWLLGPRFAFLIYWLIPWGRLKVTVAFSGSWLWALLGLIFLRYAESKFNEVAKSINHGSSRRRKNNDKITYVIAAQEAEADAEPLIDLSKIDFDKLNYTDKLYAREMLLKAMAKLEPAPDEADSPD